MRDFFIPFINGALLSAGITSDREIQIEKPTDKKFGDYSTNVAFLLAKELKRNPRELAGELIGHLSFPEGTVVKTEVAGPGFINFHLEPLFFMRSVREVLRVGDAFGRTAAGEGKTAVVEYVSANPTGPLTVGRGRGGVLGDCIANLLATQGYQITREYYFNDAGRQMQILAESVRYRYLERCGQPVEFPENHYQGEYIRDIAETLFIEHGDALISEDKLTIFKETAEGIIFASIRHTLSRLSINHDAFFNEHTLYQTRENGTSPNQAVIEALDAKGFISRHENAIWFTTTKLGQEKDKVLVKSTGDPSYRLPDIAYHVTKFERGFSLIVNVFGADHIDEYPDVAEALKILGYDTGRIRVAINQFVTTTVGGETVKMSTRKGNADLLDDLIDEVGADATRLFFIMRSKDSHLNFDIDLAKRQSKDNPVFYLQYAHARICSLLRMASREVGFNAGAATGERLTVLSEPVEIELASALLDFPEVIQSCIRFLEPQKMVEYLHGIAELYHKFYQECPILKAGEETRDGRLELSLCVRQVLGNGFALLGISAPESM